MRRYGDNKESGCRDYTNQGLSKGGATASIKRRYGDNKESGCRGYANQGPTKGGTTATIKRADADAILIKGPQREALRRQ